MNKKDFKRYMKQGLGRCALFLQSTEDREPYKEIVLWGCLHDLSFDTQSEGTRASYMYHLTTYFKDENDFLLPIVKALETVPRKSDWLLLHLCELLQCFAENGSALAKNALMKKYDQLFSVLSNKRISRGYDYERDAFERVAIVLFELRGTDVLWKIVDDMGCLFRKNPRYGANDFEWFADRAESRLGKKRFHALLARKAEQSESILRFYQSLMKTQNPTDTVCPSSRKPLEIPCADDIEREVFASGELSPVSRVRFSRRGTDEEKRKLAESIRTQSDPDLKAELLSAFAYRSDGFPLSHEIIIEYSRSAHETFSEVAFDVLTNCRSEAVKAYAQALLSAGTHTAHAVQMLITNYSEDVKELLLAALSEIKADARDTSDHHAIGLKILGAGERNIKLPKECFLYIYHTTLCSLCREYAVSALAKRRALTREIIEECRFDSNADIVRYVNQYYPAKPFLKERNIP